MNNDFLIIAVTPPEFIPGEAERIAGILSNDEANLVHIRKPMSSFDDLDTFVKTIPSEFHSRLKIHDHFNLLEKYSLAGCHLNVRNPVAHPMARSVSKSCHSLDELATARNLDYIFISPVFDSISKKGYKAAFDLKVLSERIKGKNVVALGGVTPDKISLLVSVGFRGAAMLGHFFPPLSQFPY